MLEQANKHRRNWVNAALSAVWVIALGSVFLWLSRDSLSLLHDLQRPLVSSSVLFWLFMALLAHLAGVGFGALRWRVLLSGLGFPIRFAVLVRSWLVGRFFGAVFFGVAGRDAYRLYDSARRVDRVIEPAAVLVIERICGLVAFYVVMVASVPIVRQFVTVDRQWLVATGTVSGFLAVLGLLLVFHPTLGLFLANVMPAPRSWRPPLLRFGRAVSGWHTRKAAIFAGLLASLGRLLATCLALSSLVMAVRTPLSETPSALMAGPAFLFGPRLAPFLGRGGTEGMILERLAGTAGQGLDAAALFDAAAWLILLLLPFLLGGIALIFWRARRTKSAEAGSREGAEGTSRATYRDDSCGGFDLSPVKAARHRAATADAVLGGLLGGIVAGGMIGLAEAVWLARGMVNPPELQLLWWGPMAYGLLLSGLGLAIACAASLALARFGRLPLRMGGAFAVGLGGTVSASMLIIGRWRYVRDVLHGREVTLLESLAVLVAAVVAGVVLERFFAILTGTWSFSRRVSGALTVLLFGVLIGTGALLAGRYEHPVAHEVQQVSAPGDAPDIVLVVIDALRADYLALYGGSVSTPHLDALASEGVVFRNSFAQAPWTKPSFATLFTGLYPSEHGAVGKATPLRQDVPTLAEVLNANGYYAKGFANNRNIIPSEGFGKGFDEYDYLEPNLIFGARPSSSELALYEVLRRIHTRLLSGAILVENFYEPGEGVNRSVFDWLDGAERPGGKPLFLFLHYMEPHDPYMDADRPGVGYAMIELGFRPDAAHYLEPMRAAYCDEIEHMDRCLGALLEGFKSRGLYEDAVIVVAADHGEELYDHAGWWHGETLYEEQLHVPLIIKLPRGRLGGTGWTGFARHIDMAPTLLELAGAPVPETMRGQPLFDRPVSCAENLSFAERHFGGYTLRSVRSEATKFITARPGGKPGFFDLESDPKERHPQTEPEGAQAMRLKEEMTQFEKLVQR